MAAAWLDNLVRKAEAAKAAGAVPCCVTGNEVLRLIEIAKAASRVLAGSKHDEGCAHWRDPSTCSCMRWDLVYLLEIQPPPR